MDQYDLEAATTPPSTTASSTTGEDNESSKAVVRTTSRIDLERWHRFPLETMLQALSRLRMREPVVSETEIPMLETRSTNDESGSTVHHTPERSNSNQDPARLNCQSPLDVRRSDPTQALTGRGRIGRYKNIVRPAAISEIAAENERRGVIRADWQQPDEIHCLADSWDGLWKQPLNTMRGLSQWPCSDDQRQSLQLQLADALNSGPINPLFLLVGLRKISCWISLIGLRLDKLYVQDTLPVPSQSTLDTDSPITQIQVLIEYIWACNTSDPKCIGDVLKICYQRRILTQPAFDDQSTNSRSIQTLRAHIRSIRISIYLVNILFRHKPPSLEHLEDLDEAWSLPLLTAEKAMRDEPKLVETGLGNAPFLDVTDLNLADLQNRGQLQIEWTSYWDEHLELKLNASSSILKLYWFSPTLSSYHRVEFVFLSLFDTKHENNLLQWPLRWAS
ncbi:MAG: hypothetical protein Q9212_001955 [Teloschistes hypoglaucus]